MSEYDDVDDETSDSSSDDSQCSWKTESEEEVLDPQQADIPPEGQEFIFEADVDAVKERKYELLHNFAFKSL